MRKNKRAVKRNITFLESLKAYLNKKKYALMITVLAIWMSLFMLAGTSIALLGAWVYFSLLMILACIYYVFGYCILFPLKHVLGGAKC